MAKKYSRVEIETLERFYKILGEKVFSEWEAEFHFSSSPRKYLSEIEKHIIFYKYESIDRIGVEWDDSYKGFGYWKKQHLKLVDRWYL